MSMNTAMFYGRKKTSARPFPDDADDSELSSESKSEVGATVQSPELSNSGSDDDDIPLDDHFVSCTWKEKKHWQLFKRNVSHFLVHFLQWRMM